jgi:hypothetical protein
MDGSTQAYFSTLAQISVTAVVLLISGMIAFSVYQKERGLAYADEILQEQIKISESIKNLRNFWTIGYEAFIPLNFETEFKKLYNEKRPSKIWEQGILGIQFDELEDPSFQTSVRRAIEKANPEYLRRQGWGYPIRLFFISKLVEIFSRTSSKGEANPKGIFPIIPVELGYSEWKADFEDIYKLNHIIEQLIEGDENSELVEGLKTFLSKEYEKSLHKCCFRKRKKIS